MEQWKTINEFNEYAVSSFGRVKNVRFNRPMGLSRNQQGIVHVALHKNGMQYRRSVAILVAEAFLQYESREQFNTPIHLDGNKDNCSYWNLEWRPRWFAYLYHRQFQHMDATHLIKKKIRNVDTGQLYENSWECAIQEGLIESNLVHFIQNKQRGFPNSQLFVVN